MVFVNRTANTTVLIGQVARSEKGIQLIGPTSIKDSADLKGKKIATNLGSTTEYYLQKYLKENNLANDVKLINLDPGSQVAALIRGDVDAIVSFLEVGVRALQSDRHHLIAGWGSSLMLAATRQFANTEPDAVQGTLRALQRAAADVKADPKAALAAVSGEYGLLDQAYENYLSYGGIDLTPQYPTSTQNFLQDVSAFLTDQGKFAKPFDFCQNLDLSHLRKLGAEFVTARSSCK
jgi:ABC-type nitrate/sulfonate/bicarbonate transport system substrate-binding protein